MIAQVTTSGSTIPDTRNICGSGSRSRPFCSPALSGAWSGPKARASQPGCHGAQHAFAWFTPGTAVTGRVHATKELHEIGNVLVPVYLILHAGAVVLHAIAGKPIWKKMLFLD